MKSLLLGFMLNKAAVRAHKCGSKPKFNEENFY